MNSPFPSKEQKKLPKPTADQIESWVRNNSSSIKERYSSSRGEKCLLIDNPAVSGDKGYHVGIFPESGRVHDFRPNMSDFNGDFVKFVALVNNYRWIDAYYAITGNNAASLEELSKMATIRLNEKPKTKIKEEIIERIKLKEGYKPIISNPDTICKMAIAYLNKRQISLEEAIQFKIHYGVNSICFPYYEYDELVYWQVRDILSKRFEFPTGLSGQMFLWNFDNIEPMGDIFITESIFNASVVGKNAVSAGTAKMSREQILKIKTMQPKRVILCPDNDAAGLSSIVHNFFAMEKEALFKNANHNRILYAVPPEKGTDWNDFAVINNRIENKNVVIEKITNTMKPITIMDIIKIKKEAGLS